MTSVAEKSTHMAWLAGVGFSALAKLQSKLTTHAQTLFSSLVSPDPANINSNLNSNPNIIPDPNLNQGASSSFD